LNLLTKIWEKIKKLWAKANLLEKIGLGLIVLVIIATRVVKWAIIFKICCNGVLWAWKTLL
jgi:flagellar biosynthesis/type III secretory pathway M-ring protein FliF/YscJ